MEMFTSYNTRTLHCIIASTGENSLFSNELFHCFECCRPLFYYFVLLTGVRILSLADFKSSFKMVLFCPNINVLQCKKFLRKARPFIIFHQPCLSERKSVEMRVKRLFKCAVMHKIEAKGVAPLCFAVDCIDHSTTDLCEKCRISCPEQ